MKVALKHAAPTLNHVQQSLFTIINCTFEIEGDDVLVVLHHGKNMWKSGGTSGGQHAWKRLTGKGELLMLDITVASIG